LDSHVALLYKAGCLSHVSSTEQRDAASRGGDLQSVPQPRVDLARRLNQWTSLREERFIPFAV